MNANQNPTPQEINELIDICGSTIYHAVQACEATILRRAADGKSSPVAEAKKAALLKLPPDYMTPKMKQHEINDRESGYGL